MNPLPDRVVILGLVATVALCFALVFWFVRATPGPNQQPMLWRESPNNRPAPPLM
ncbi:MAG: hypothetical protein WCL59_01160 [Cyanobium sp. ELA507]